MTFCAPVPRIADMIVRCIVSHFAPSGVHMSHDASATAPELHAVTIRETVSFHGAWAQFDDNGEPRDSETVNRAAQAQLEQLGWWAHALRTARADRPYVAV